MNQPHDVQVVLTHDRKYPFHASTLARSSIIFAELLTELNAAKLGSRARALGIKTRWLIELVEIPTTQYPAGRLELIPLSSTGERIDGFSGRVLNENGRIPMKIFDHWERVLYAFYGTEIRIADKDMGAALDDCIGLIKVAEYLGCVNLIGKSVEVALLKHGQALFRAIQKVPHAWANMSFRISSEVIFREAIVHLAGHWNTWKTDRACMQSLRETHAAKMLAEKYHQVLVQKSRTLENRLMSHYPGDMAMPMQDIPIKREAYAKDILVWMALCWFRHWLGQRLISGRGHVAPDGGYSLYKCISDGGDAYMDKAILTQFHGMFPMTKKALNVLENHLLEIKACMAEWVEKSDLMKTNCQLNVQQYPVDYITCVEFENGDFPWIAAEQKEKEMSELKKGKRPGGNDIAQRNLKAAKRHQEQRDLGDAGDESANEEEDEGEVTDDDVPVRRDGARRANFQRANSSG